MTKEPDGETIYPSAVRNLSSRYGRPQWQRSDALIYQGEQGAQVWAWLVEPSDRSIDLETEVRLCLRGMYATGYELITVSHPTSRSALLTFKLGPRPSR